MKYFVALFLALPIVISITLLSSPSHAISLCNGPCRTLNDCAGQLICTDGRCRDDPDVGTHTCPNTPSPSDGGCRPLATVHCGGRSYHRYRCSPPVTSSTRATLTNNDFTRGGGSGPSACDGRYHRNSELIVALSTGWFADRSRCGHKIKITSTKTRRSVLAKVVDECDSASGCPLCRNDDVDGSSAVWHALGLDIGVGEEAVTWSMA